MVTKTAFSVTVLFLIAAVQHERGPRHSTLRRQLALCLKNTSPNASLHAYTAVAMASACRRSYGAQQSAHGYDVVPDGSPMATAPVPMSVAYMHFQRNDNAAMATKVRDMTCCFKFNRIVYYVISLSNINLVSLYGPGL